MRKNKRILFIIFIVTGSYIPKTTSQYLQSVLTSAHPNTQRKTTRLMGYSFVIFDTLLLISTLMLGGVVLKSSYESLLLTIGLVIVVIFIRMLQVITTNV